MRVTIYTELEAKKKKGQKSFAVLIDPDKVNPALLDEIIDRSVCCPCRLFSGGR
jgi:putative glycerol-1-phosphate prenyltransferase